MSERIPASAHDVIEHGAKQPLDLEQVASDWVHKNVVLAEHCNIEYSDLIASLTKLLKSASK